MTELKKPITLTEKELRFRDSMVSGLCRLAACPVNVWAKHSCSGVREIFRDKLPPCYKLPTRKTELTKAIPANAPDYQMSEKSIQRLLRYVAAAPTMTRREMDAVPGLSPRDLRTKTKAQLRKEGKIR